MAPGPLSLPTELWLNVVLHLLAEDSRPGRFLDVARLSWTCRNAYQAAYPFIWHRLCLVFRDNFENVPEVYPKGLPYEQDIDRVQIARHQDVMDSSVYPRYWTGQLDMNSERLERIRAVSEYSGLQPFVVLDGKLYLASLLENEGNQSEPDLSGIESLWGNSETANAVRIDGGLVLFPYPLHLVNELIMDALATGEHCFWEGPYDGRRGDPKFFDRLPFILSMDPKRLRTFRFYSRIDQYEWDAYHPITDRYKELTRHDYFIPADSRSCPAFGPATRHVRMLHGFYFDDDEFFANLADLPHLASLEVLGVADVPRECRRLFSLPTLERLVLDFECGEGTGFTPFQVHLPKLQELTISFELAAPLLEGGPNSMFPADPTTFAFPALTRLTLVDIEDRTVARQVGEFDKVPRVPFHHMPNLQNVHIPFGHRGIRNTHSIDGVTLVSLATHTRVQSFIAPGLVEIVSSEDQVAQMPVFAKHLTRVQVSHSVVDELARWIALPDADLLST